MSPPNSIEFPEKMNVKTLKDGMKSIQDKLDDKDPQVIILVGEPGTGKTSIAGKIVDEAMSRGLLLSGALWFYLNKKYDEESFLLDIAYQLSLLSTRRVLEDEGDDKDSGKKGKKKEEEKKKKEQEMSLFWASEVWEDEDKNEKEKMEEKEENKEAEEKKQESELPQQAASAVVVNGANNEVVKEEEEEEEEMEKKRKKAEVEEEEEKKKKEKKLEEEEKKKKKGQERLKKLKQKVSALLNTKKYLLVLDGYNYGTKPLNGRLSEEEIQSKLDTHFKEIMLKLETYVRETMAAFPKILITRSSYSCLEGSSNQMRQAEISELSHVDGEGNKDSSKGPNADGSSMGEGEVEGETRVGGDGVKDENLSATGKGEGNLVMETRERPALANGSEGNGESSAGDKASGASSKWGMKIRDLSPITITITKLSKEECEAFFKENLQFMDLSRHHKFKDLCEAIAESSKGLPAAIVVIAKALGHIEKWGHPMWTLDRAIDRVISNKLSGNDEDLFRCGYDMLPDGEITNCCWYSRQLFSKLGAVHYNELISFWIMEGYLDATNCIKKTYNRGYSILAELMNRGMFIMREDNLVSMEEKALKITDDRGHNIGGTSSLGLANIFDKNEWDSLGRITLADGVLKTPCNHKAEHMVSTVLMDENRLCREVPEDLFKRLRGLQVLVLLKPILKSLPSSLYRLKNLQILVLQDCELLQDVNDISEVRTLAVLEISGATSLKKIPDDLFERLTNLRCLNLSKSGIRSLPSPSENSQENSSALRWLILRGCANLEELPSLSKFKVLEVLDLSGSSSLKKIRDNFFTPLEKVQMIDFSETLIEAFPIVGGLKELTRLFFRKCKKLKRIPRLPPNIYALDLSGCTQLLEIRDESLEKKTALKTLDLSQTEIASLSSISMPSGLSKLSLNGFSNLEKLPSTKDLGFLQLLDLSVARNFKEIHDESFQHLTCIQVLNLSETKITTLPSLDKLGSLHQLVLSGCQHLCELPNVNALEKLEILDLSQCTSLGTLKLQDLAKLSRLQQLSLSGAYRLEEFDAASLMHMGLLQKLDLSGNPCLKSIVGLSNLKNLRQLFLKDCKHFEKLECEEALANLEVLDLSGTAVESLPSSLLNFLTRLEVLDLSRTKVQTYPETLGMTHLKRLILPDLKNIEWGEIRRLPEELTFDDHSIFTITDCQASSTASTISVTVAVSSIKQHSEEELLNRYQQKLIRAFQSLKYSVHKEEFCPPAEAYGFHKFPLACKSFLKSAEYLSFIDTSFTSLSDVDIDTMKDMKGCWLDRCPNMRSILHGGEENDPVVEKLEILWLSNLPSLNSLCSESVKNKCFQNLTSLYLDCCPKLVHIFSSPHIPENLSVLEIRFCDNLKILFDCGKSSEFRLEKLEKLLLFSLPELKGIGAKLPPQLRPKILECPKYREEESELSEELADQTGSSV